MKRGKAFFQPANDGLYEVAGLWLNPRRHHGPFMPEEFQYDVFLSHSSKDKAVVRTIRSLSASTGGRCRDLRLQADGLKVPFHFGFAQPGMSAQAFVSDWAQLEAGTCGRRNLRFRDPLNRERRAFFDIPNWNLKPNPA